MDLFDRYDYECEQLLARQGTIDDSDRLRVFVLLVDSADLELRNRVESLDGQVKELTYKLESLEDRVGR